MNQDKYNSHLRYSISHSSTSQFTALTYLLLILLLISCLPSQAVQFWLPANVQRCLSENSIVGELIVSEFSVRPLGSVVSVAMSDPSGNPIYSKDASQNSEEDKIKFAHTSSRGGEYRICFYNREGRVQEQIELQFRTGQGGLDDDFGPSAVAKKDALKPMEVKLKQLEITVSQIHNEMKQLAQKEVLMRQMNDTTSSRIVWFSIFSTLLLFGLKLGEILYLRQYFKSRRMIT